MHMSMTLSATSELLSLPEELRRLIADKVVLEGESYWLSATCLTARADVHAACLARGLHGSRSKLTTIFTSLKRMRIAVEIPQVRALVIAAPEAIGVENRPVSLDGHYRWSGIATHALVRAAPLNVIDYVWAHWEWSVHWTHPDCALKAASTHGRVDMLTHMESLQSTADCDSLHSVLRLAVQGLREAFTTVNFTIVTPLLNGAAVATFDWYHGRMESLEKQYSTTSVATWRRQFESWASLQQLAFAASNSRLPYQSLTLLTDRVWPLLGDRSPMRRPTALLCIATSALVSVTCPTKPGSVGVWQWIKSRYPGGLMNLLEATSERPDLRPRGWTLSAKLHAACFKVRDVAVYNWMVANTDWLKTAVFPIRLGWWLPSELTEVQENLQKYADPVAASIAWLTIQWNMAKPSDSSRARTIVAAALCDLLFREEKILDHDAVDLSKVFHAVTRVIEWSIDAFKDAIHQFELCNGNTAWYDAIPKHHVVVLLVYLKKKAIATGGDGREVPDSINWVRELITTLEYYGRG